MPLRWSQFLVAIEAVLILTPLTLLALYGFFVILLLGGLANESWSSVLLPLAALATLGCGWRLALCFIREGLNAFLSQPVGLWVLPGVVGVLTLISELIVLSGRMDGSSITHELYVFAAGWPALIPLAHLSLESWSRCRPTLESAQGTQQFRMLSPAHLDDRSSK